MQDTQIMMEHRLVQLLRTVVLLQPLMLAACTGCLLRRSPPAHRPIRPSCTTSGLSMCTARPTPTDSLPMLRKPALGAVALYTCSSLRPWFALTLTSDDARRNHEITAVVHMYSQTRTYQSWCIRIQALPWAVGRLLLFRRREETREHVCARHVTLEMDCSRSAVLSLGPGRH